MRNPKVNDLINLMGTLELCYESPKDIYRYLTECLNPDILIDTTEIWTMHSLKGFSYALNYAFNTMKENASYTVRTPYCTIYLIPLRNGESNEYNAYFVVDSRTAVGGILPDIKGADIGIASAFQKIRSYLSRMERRNGKQTIYGAYLIDIGTTGNNREYFYPFWNMFDVFDGDEYSVHFSACFNSILTMEFEMSYVDIIGKYGRVDNDIHVISVIHSVIYNYLRFVKSSMTILHGLDPDGGLFNYEEIMCEEKKGDK